MQLLVHTDGEVPVVALAGALDQVLDNLVDNALDVAPTGSTLEIGVQPSVGLDVTDRVVLTVRDHGPGLGPEERQRATDRFWRGPSSAPSGTGLGLAIVDRLVRTGGGEVELCEPAEGTGLEVRVLLLPAR